LSEVKQFRELWNAEAHEALPRWKEMPPKRVTAARARLRERPLEAWREVIRRISASAFCRGEKGDWRATPDWLLRPDTAAKVLEGQYDDTGPPQRIGPQRATPRPEPPCEGCGATTGYRAKCWGHVLCPSCSEEANHGNAASVEAWLSKHQQTQPTKEA